MELLLSAITSALAHLSETAVKDAYESLKNLLHRKFGSKSDLADALEKLEKKPDSAGRRETLQEEMAEAKVDADQEMVEAARDLAEKINALAGGLRSGPSIKQSVTGNENIVIGSLETSGSVTIGGEHKKQ